MFTILAAALTLASPRLNVRVDGDGYLRFAREGRVVYAKQAVLRVVDGHLEAPGGASYLPEIDVPANATTLDVNYEGLVTATLDGQKYPIAQIVIAVFPKTSHLMPDGDFLIATDRPTLGNPGDGLNGVIRTKAEGAGVRVQGAPRQGAVSGVQGATKPSPVVHAASTGVHHSATVTDAAEIIIRIDSTVQGESFTLGEVADISADPELVARLAAVDLGRAPAIGVTRGLDSAFVMAKIRTAGFKPDHITINAPSGAHLERASQTVNAAQFLEAARTAVKDQLGLDVPLHLTTNVNDAIVPPGQVTLQPATVLKSGNSISLMIDIRVDDKHITTRSLVLAPNAGTGEGVKTGQVVKIVVRLNGASLECGGRARSSGWIGETVTVVTDTGAVKTGVVTSATTVEVKL